MKVTESIMIFVLLLLCQSRSTGQVYQFGAAVGLNLENTRLKYLSPEYVYPYYFDPVLTWSSNLVLSYKGKRRLGLSLEPGYIQKGGNYRQFLFLPDRTVRFKVNYFQMPVLFDWYLSKRFCLSIGPEVGYLINFKTEERGVSNNYTNCLDRRVELAGVLGVQYEIANRLYLALRFSRSLTYYTRIIFFTQTHEKPYTPSSHAFNEYLQFSVRYKWACL